MKAAIIDDYNDGDSFGGAGGGFLNKQNDDEDGTIQAAIEVNCILEKNFKKRNFECLFFSHHTHRIH